MPRGSSHWEGELQEETAILGRSRLARGKAWPFQEECVFKNNVSVGRMCAREESALEEIHLRREAEAAARGEKMRLSVERS